MWTSMKRENDRFTVELWHSLFLRILRIYLSKQNWFDVSVTVKGLENQEKSRSDRKCRNLLSTTRLVFTKQKKAGNF